MVKSRFSNCDQTNAEEKVKEWQTQTPNDKFFFRKYSGIYDAKFENAVVSNSSNGEDLDDEDIRVNVSTVLSKIPLCPSNNLTEKAVEQIWQ